MERVHGLSVEGCHKTILEFLNFCIEPSKFMKSIYITMVKLQYLQKPLNSNKRATLKLNNSLNIKSIEL